MNSPVNETTAVKQTGNRRKLVVAFGSVFGVVATIIGLMAVFFPDVFNLEKSTVAEFTIQVSNPDEADRLNTFLEANSKRIVKLDVSICATLEVPCASIRREDNTLVVASLPEAGECAQNSLEDGGVVFDFDGFEGNREAGTAWAWEKFEPCASGGGEGVSRVNGYFLVPESAGYAMGWLEWMLSPISEKDVILKKY